MYEIDSILQLHREGLQRISKVIDGNPDYDVLLRHQLSQYEQRYFSDLVGVDEKCQRAISSFETKIRKQKPKIIVANYSGFVCDGLTKNNIREFEFFERICNSLSIKILNKNYSKCLSVPIEKISDKELNLIEGLIGDVRKFYMSRCSITASLVHQQTLYSQSFFNFLLSFRRDGAVLPAAVVLANDHSPVRVALSMIMKEMQVPRIYLQHAEVTGNFPVLDFEYSVLRNRRSREIYQSIGPVSGKTYVLPRHKDEFAYSQLIRQRQNGITAVVYPTSRVVIENLKKILQSLEKNPAIARILVKQHPGSTKLLVQTLGESSISFVDNIPNEDHIAIVGNSSVVIELLHRGIPVYQNFNFDPIAPDYYGFVKSGITFEVDTRELSQPFWKAYPPIDAWLEAYAAWDPCADAACLQEEAQFLEDMARLKQEVLTDPPVAQRNRIKGLLRAQIKALVKKGIIRTININQNFSRCLASVLLNKMEIIATLLLDAKLRIINFLRVNAKIELSDSGPLQYHDSSSVAGGASEVVQLHFLERTLSEINKPADWLQMSERVAIFSSRTLIAALKVILQDRRPVLESVFEGWTEWPAGSAVGTWGYLQKIERGLLEVNIDELNKMAEFIYYYNEDLYVKMLLEQSFLITVARCGACGQTDRFDPILKWYLEESWESIESRYLSRKLHAVPDQEYKKEIDVKNLRKDQLI